MRILMAGFEERIAVHCYPRHIADDLCEHAEHLDNIKSL